MKTFEEKIYENGDDAGICPRCDGDSITYGTGEPEDDGFFYYATCDDCGLEFKEYYNMIFDGSRGSVMEETGE
jgi:hypothetical protein